MTTTSTGDGEFSAVVGSYAISDDIVIAHNVTYDDHVSITGTLTVNAGKTFGEGAASKNLTVSGAVQVNGTLDLDRSSSDGNASFGSLTIANTGTVEAPSHGNLTLTTDATDQFLYETISGATFNNNDGTVIITGDGRVKPRAGTGNFHNVTLNASGNTIEQSAVDVTIEGDLTITAGEWHTGTAGLGYSNLTVAGITRIGPDSGAADQATLNCHSGTISLGSGITSSAYGLYVKQGGTFVGGSGTHTLGSLIVYNNAAAKCTLTSGVTTIDGEHGGDNFNTVIYSGSTFDNADGTVTYTGIESSIYWQKNAHNIILNTSNTIIIGNALVLDNDLTITQGTLTTSGSNNALTVTGDCDVTGTLTLNDSTVAVGALRTNSNAALTLGSSGTLELTTASNFGGTEGASYSWRNADGTSDINLGGTLTVSAAGYFEPRTAPDYASVINNVVWNTNYYWVGKMTFGGTLVVNASKLMQTYNGSQDCIVTGDVTLNGHLKALGDNVSAMTFGSLTIASGGTYTATSGTTTITKANGGTDGRAFYIHSSATFTHNNGLVKFTASSPQVAPTSSGQTSTSHPFYDLEQTTGTMQWKAEHHKVLNNCTMKGSAFNGSTGNVHVLGICRLTGETFNSGDTATNDNNFFQTLIVESGATVDLSAINITVGSLRNLGGTIQ